MQSLHGALAMYVLGFVPRPRHRSYNVLHTLLHLYNAAPPEAKSTARAGAAFLAGAALAVLATACSPAHAGAGHGTIAP